MRIDLRALLVSAMVMVLVWLAIDGKVAPAGIAADNVFGWGLLGFSVWICLVGRPGHLGRWLNGQEDRRP